MFLVQRSWTIESMFKFPLDCTPEENRDAPIQVRLNPPHCSKEHPMDYANWSPFNVVVCQLRLTGTGNYWKFQQVNLQFNCCIIELCLLLRMAPMRVLQVRVFSLLRWKTFVLNTWLASKWVIDELMSSTSLMSFRFTSRALEKPSIVPVSVRLPPNSMI